MSVAFIPRCLRGTAAALLLVLGVGGCTGTGPIAGGSTESQVAACERRAVEHDRVVAAHGQPDAEGARIRGWPYLRVDRLLAALVDEVSTDTQRAAWLTRAADLDRRARRVEIQGLSVPAPHATAALESCRRLFEHYAMGAGAWAQLRGSVAVPDDYSLWKRVLGVYPLISRLVLAGVRRLQAREQVAWQPAVGTDAVEYALAPLPGAAAARTANGELARDALGIPRPTEAQLAVLFARHAPRLNITTASADDRIGALRLDVAGDQVLVDADRPTVYVRTAYTRFEGMVLLQLVYSVWFQARPQRGPLDLLAGQLDALTWRVTLDTDGAPLLHDAMHNCGCYHMFFPGPRLQRHAQDAAGLEEPLWVALRVPAHSQQSGTGALTVYLKAGSHYIYGLGPAAANAAAEPLQMLPLDNLRALPLAAGRRASLYDADGVVPQSRRAEGLLLWPMGIRAPGAMRQWGHHATAFVGRRHFDEAHLIERYFKRI